MACIRLFRIVQFRIVAVAPSNRIISSLYPAAAPHSIMQFSRMELVFEARKTKASHWPGAFCTLSDVKTMGVAVAPRAMSVPSTIKAA